MDTLWTTKGKRMTQHDPKHVFDIICAAFGGSGSAACLFAFEALPIMLQVLSLISILLSIVWFGVRFYDRFLR